MVANAKRVVAQTWSIAERRFRENYTIRKQMFHSIVVPTATYGCEVTGFREWEGLECQMRKYFKWTLGLNQSTKTAIVIHETKQVPLHITTAHRAMRYEERSMDSPCEILKACIKEVQEGAKSPFATDREAYCRAAGWSVQTVGQILRSGGSVCGYLKLKHTEVVMQLIGVQIAPLRYACVSAVDVPLYLNRSRHFRMIARFRCENEERGRERWRDDKRCRVCGGAEETLEHMAWNCCRFMRSVPRMLCQSGDGVRDMLRLLECRRKYRGQEGE